MLAATDYPLLNIFWSMLLLFLWIAWFWILIVVIMDVFRRHDIGGLGKTLWLIFLIFIPFLGVLVYVIAEGQHMTEQPQGAGRRAKAVRLIRQAGRSVEQRRRRGHGDPERPAAARQRGDHPGGVRADQAQGAERLTAFSGSAGRLVTETGRCKGSRWTGAPCLASHRAPPPQPLRSLRCSHGTEETRDGF